MKTALFIDFDDSFSFNVIQELTEVGLKVRVMNWKDVEIFPEADLLVFGPGPGHPDDYQVLFPILEKWLSEEKFFLGVCLGHQIFWRLKGKDVVSSKRPLHGQKVKLSLSPRWQTWLQLPSEVKVQRYNSLAVLDDPLQAAKADMENCLSHGEIMMSRNKHIITYQFHPESVGTSFRRAFFVPLLRDLV